MFVSLNIQNRREILILGLIKCKIVNLLMLNSFNFNRLNWVNKLYWDSSRVSQNWLETILVFMRKNSIIAIFVKQDFHKRAARSIFKDQLHADFQIMCEIYCDFRFNKFVSNISDKQLSNKNLLTSISKFRLFLRKYRCFAKKINI